MKPEFSRPERVDTIGEVAREVAVEADANERAALARRFAIPAIDRLAARVSVMREGDAIVATGVVEAAVVQACSATGEPVPARISEPVTLRFAEAIEGDGEVELDEAAIDTLPIEGGAIDLGEAAAETMALALDPFPRAPGADDVLRAAGVVGEDEVTPFSALSGLKAKLEGRGG